MSRTRIHQKIRQTLQGTAERPRLSVYRSLTNLHVQLVDDTTGKTIAQATSLKTKGSLIEKATAVGKLIAEAAKTHKIKAVVFDRGGFRYHGAVKALADSARKEGLKF